MSEYAERPSWMPESTRQGFKKTVVAASAVSSLIAGCDAPTWVSDGLQYPTSKITCVEAPQLPLSKQLERADNCITTRTAAVAFVAYGLDEASATVIARETEATIRQATNGLFAPNFVVTMPTPKLNDAFLEANPKNCASTDFDDKNGAVLADKFMSLGSYSMVMSATTMKDCDEKLLGAAEVSRGRYASGYEISPGNKASRKILAHEYGHGVEGLGHAGDIGTLVTSLLALDIEPKTPVNLDEYLDEDPKFDEYGEDCNIMGKSGNDTGSDGIPTYIGGSHILAPNPIQLHSLTWPERIKAKANGSDEDTTEILLGNNEVTLDPLKNQYARLPLETPQTFSVPHPKDPNHKSVFTELVLAPDSHCKESSNLFVYLKGVEGGLVQTMMFDIWNVVDKKVNERTIIMDSRSITVKANNNGTYTIVAK